jgi:uncharacterized protein (UPF0147 family)
VFVPDSLNDHRRHAKSVIASNLGREHLLEIMRVQAWICADGDVPKNVRSQAIAYAERLFEQFGLGDAAQLRADPVMAGLAASIDRP